MADEQSLRTEDRRKRARQNGVVQPLLTGRFSFFSLLPYSKPVILVTVLYKWLVGPSS